MTSLCMIRNINHQKYCSIYYTAEQRCGLAHILCVETNVYSVRVIDMLQCWALQFGASLADKVESSRILGYVVHCLSSIVVNEHTCIMGKICIIGNLEHTTANIIIIQQTLQYRLLQNTVPHSSYT